MKAVINLFVFFISMLLLISCNSKEEESLRINPNVILIMTDDQGYGDLSLHGNDSLRTPHIDFLGTNGAKFDRFYVSPVCAPTRASLLTGRYHLRTGVYWVTRGAENMDPDEKTMAEVFMDNDYATGCFGKWHNGAHYPYTPTAQGFDEFVGFKAGHWSNYFNTVLDDNNDTLDTNGYITDVFTDQALDFIRRNRNNPFFCYIPYNAPHTPYQVPDKYFERYVNDLHIKDSINNRKRATIYAMCENIDENIGRIYCELEKLGIAGNTIIVFLTDNGPNGDRFNGNMRGRKGSVHEGGVRVPCFFYWKNVIEGGKLITGLSAHIDILPTLVNLCNLDLQGNRPLDGIDLSDYLLNKEKSQIIDREIYNHQNHGSELKMFSGAIRTPEYRFVITGLDQFRLYNMIKDPEERVDISEENIEIAREFYTKYLHWFNEVKPNAEKERRIPIGYQAAPDVYLPAHEAQINSGLSYQANVNGWAHDWIIDWDHVNDTISWNIDVIEKAQYEIFIQYNVKMNDTGSDINVVVGNERINSTLSQPFYSETHPNYDRVVRRVEAFEKDWALMSIGSLTIDVGKQNIKIFAIDIPSAEVAELKGMLIKRL